MKNKPENQKKIEKWTTMQIILACIIIFILVVIIGLLLRAGPIYK